MFCIVHTDKVQWIFVNPLQLVRWKFWQVNDMVDYTVLYQVSPTIVHMYICMYVCIISILSVFLYRA